MCYCCTLCNECGRADEMRARLGQRKCPQCEALVLDNDIHDCPNCGAKLPPSFPPLPSMPGVAQ